MRRAEIASANGACTARGLAQALNAAVTGRLLSSPALLRELAKPVVQGRDEILGAFVPEITFGRGFGLQRSPKNDTWLVGHMGHGGQMVAMDVRRRLAFAYVTNGIKMGGGDAEKNFQRLLNAVYDCVD